VTTVSKRIFTLFCLALLALAPLRAAQGQSRLNLIRDAEIREHHPDLRDADLEGAGLDPSASRS